MADPIRETTERIRVMMAESARLAAEMATAELKAMWDATWPTNAILGGVYIEDIHAELNRRGEGIYCAV